MLKKLASLLFEEEEEVIEEELSPKESPVVKEKSLINAMNPKPIEEVKLEELVVQEEMDEIEHEAVEDIIKPSKPEFGIAFDEPSPFKDKPKVINEKPIYEFKPVISPMFGVSESKKSQPIRQSVNPPQTLKRSRINTVISPIYGDVENKRDEKSVSARVAQVAVKHDPYIETVKPDLPRFKSENYSLDDLLSPIKPQDDISPIPELIQEVDDEFAHQFSLFDDIK
jgi:hypothetical protein